MNQNELLGMPVLTVYVPDDKTKFQILPHLNDLPFSRVVRFSPLGVRKDGTIMRLSSRLQTFSTKRLMVAFFCRMVIEAMQMLICF